jgi:VWFA-related protein
MTDLKAEDLEVYDNGQRQEIRFFSEARATAQPLALAPAAEQTTRSFTNRAIEPAGAATTATEESATILLIDESHIAWNDMTNARAQMLTFLGKVAPSERVGLYTMTSLGFRVLVEITTDHAALIDRLKKFVPTAQSLAQAQEEENRNRQHIDEVRNVSDLNLVNGNNNDVPDGQQTVDPQLRAMGSNPIRASLIVLSSVARHLAAVPGHKNVVWVSTDNVFADWQDHAAGIEKGPNALDSFAIHTQEAMNEAHAAVYPLDVSQVEPGATTADLQHMNVELSPAAKDNASLGGGKAPQNNAPGRITADMQQDTRPIQGTVREVAQATGGRAIRRSGDLAAAISGIVEDGRATYQVSFSPSGQADDRYHAIQIKLHGRRGVTLRYRTGYLFAKEPVTLKDRFENAIWRPLDVTEIAITAEIAQESTVTSVKVNVAAGDLGLRQQADRWMDKLDVFFIQRDDAGLHNNIDGKTLGLRLKAETYQNALTQGVAFGSKVVIQPGMASLRVLVVDENSGRIGSVTIPSLPATSDH